MKYNRKKNNDNRLTATTKYIYDNEIHATDVIIWLSCFCAAAARLIQILY